MEDDEPFDEYCKRMRRDGTWAGNMEVQALSVLRKVNVCIHQANQPLWLIPTFPDQPVRTKGTAVAARGLWSRRIEGDETMQDVQDTVHYQEETFLMPLRICPQEFIHLTYEGGDHYNSVRRLSDAGGDGPGGTEREQARALAPRWRWRLSCILTFSDWRRPVAVLLTDVP